MTNAITDMQQILDMSVHSHINPSSGISIAKAVKKDSYQTLVQHGNLRTYSTGNLLAQCPRKYMRMKLTASMAGAPRESSVTFAFGHAVGAAVAVYDKTLDRGQAIMAAFLAWDVDLLAEERRSPTGTGKSFYEAVWAIYAYEDFHRNESPLDEYEVVQVEATVAVDFEDGHYYSGHIDELLRHKESGRYLVKENKTDGSVTIQPAKYSNSDQALSYSVVIDMLGANSYTVYYCVYCVPEQRWVSFEFVKTIAAKAEWLQDQLLLDQTVDHYTELNFFPKRGNQCFSYNRPCEYYELCDINPQLSFGKTYADLPLIKSIDDIDAIEKVDYRTTLSAIVARQTERNSDGTT